MKKYNIVVKIVIIIAAVLLVWFAVMWAFTPKRVFRNSYSTLLYAADGTLLNAHIAKDGQWRFPPSDTVPYKFGKAITAYEDRYFYFHPGVNPVSMFKAAVANFKKGSIVRGGSTITMQVSRISSEKRERTYWRKFVEINRALFIELIYSKDEILAMYASHAPFGGNIVGIEAASWRYFSRPAASLSWAESAMLAVLPNSPSLIHLSRNRNLLLKKRDTLLKTLHEMGEISNDDYSLALSEPLPESPSPLPSVAPHLAGTMLKEHEGEIIKSSIDTRLQTSLQNMADNYAHEYTVLNNVHNVAILVKEIESGKVKAYIGNASFKADERFCNNVDIIKAPRSTGSILKPVLYAAMLSDGLILPRTFIVDTPLYLDGFSPQNFNKSYSGVVNADEAIIRSLNVPLVRMLRSYSIDRFLKLLRSLGISTMNRDADHYGASLILGGAEASPWDIAEMYRQLVNKLITKENSDLSQSSLWFMVDAMSRLSRPEEEAEWQQFESMKKIAWKTGTSYGGKDAWAVGMDTRHVVVVWVGNATGEGRAGMTGVGYAAPILFRTFSMLPGGEWFEPPYSNMQDEAVCRVSGYKASQYCTEVDTIPIPQSGARTSVCPYHKIVHLNKEKTMRVNSTCYSVSKIVSEPWFTLSPTQEFYYSKCHINYRPLPPMMPGCINNEEKQLEIVYPENGTVLYAPKDLSGKRQSIVCEAVHLNPDAVIYWHIDNEYLGSTQDIHNMAIQPSAGHHTLTIVDNDGNRTSIKLEVKE